MLIALRVLAMIDIEKKNSVKHTRDRKTLGERRKIRMGLLVLQPIQHISM